MSSRASALQSLPRQQHTHLTIAKVSNGSWRSIRACAIKRSQPAGQSWVQDWETPGATPRNGQQQGARQNSHKHAGPGPASVNQRARPDSAQQSRAGGNRRPGSGSPAPQGSGSSVGSNGRQGSSAVPTLSAAATPTDLLKLATAPGFRERFRLAPGNPRLPALNSIVIVEGLSDCAAVQRAANVAVYICDGDTVLSSAAAEDLALLQRWPGGLVILTDPDVPGRELRLYLDDRLAQGHQQSGSSRPSVLHAFVPVEAATSTIANSRHDIGSVGVENAAPAAILASLEAAAPSFPSNRKEFTKQQLADWGLTATFDAKASGTKLRRNLLCSALGIDPCTGGALLTVLNRFFSRQQVESAMQQVASKVLSLGH